MQRPGWLAVFLFGLAINAPLRAEEPPPPTLPSKEGKVLVVPGETRPQVEDNKKKCDWGCAKWGRQCDIDVRGVRRCQTVCEKFDTVCL